MKRTIRQCRGAAIVVETHLSPVRGGSRVITMSDGCVQLTPAKLGQLVDALTSAKAEIIVHDRCLRERR